MALAHKSLSGAWARITDDNPKPSQKKICFIVNVLTMKVKEAVESPARLSLLNKVAEMLKRFLVQNQLDKTARPSQD
tara:strand:- start:281 stop:511 length:231 start_codon:yes stop_codon:yes gene_type:complete